MTHELADETPSDARGKQKRVFDKQNMLNGHRTGKKTRMELSIRKNSLSHSELSERNRELGSGAYHISTVGNRKLLSSIQDAEGITIESESSADNCLLLSTFSLASAP